MPKKFALFLATAQAILTLMQSLFYVLLLAFFPGLAANHTVLLIVILVLSVCFLAFSLLDYYFDSRLIDIGYVLSSIWLVFSTYALLLSLLAWILGQFLRPDMRIFGDSAVLISAALTLYGLINARILRKIKLDIRLENLPEFWRGKTAVVASDLHLGRVLSVHFSKKIVKAIQAENPDIVFIPGDFFDGVHTNFPSLAAPFKNLRPPLGTYYCSGNHELYAGYEDCEKAIKDTGITILENQKIDVQGLQIAGLAYGHETDETVRGLMASLHLDQQRAAILLKHVPNHFAEIEPAGVGLQLSGHSHQGQIWPGSLITRKVWHGYDYGLKQFGKMQVYTSSGVGTWGPPLRVFTKSEILKIIFK